jgi:hypothetical protein
MIYTKEQFLMQKWFFLAFNTSQCFTQCSAASLFTFWTNVFIYLSIQHKKTFRSVFNFTEQNISEYKSINYVQSKLFQIGEIWTVAWGVCDAASTSHKYVQTLLQIFVCLQFCRCSPLSPSKTRDATRTSKTFLTECIQGTYVLLKIHVKVS